MFQDPSQPGSPRRRVQPGRQHARHPATENGNVYLWNAAAGGAQMATLYGPKGGLVQSIAFSPRGGILAGTSDNDKDHKYVTCVWDTGNFSATFQDPGSHGVTRIAFSPDGSILAVGDENAYTYIWNMNWHSS